MKDVMLDLETLGTRYDAMIISIGAVYFDRNTGEIGRAFSMNIDSFEFRDRFTTDRETIEWWFTQSDRARSLAMEYPASLKSTLEGLVEFLRTPDVKLWSHATFDMPILAHAFEVCGIKHPVPFRNMRDLRTLMDLAGPSADMIRAGVHHHALDDAKYQAKYAADAMQRLNGKN